MVTRNYVTGVANSNQFAQILYEEEINAIDPEYEALTEEEQEQLEEYEPSYLLYGDWKKNKEGLYEPYDGKYGFSLIDNRDLFTLQVVKSKWYLPCRKTSPCYPVQGDLDSPLPKDEADRLAYCLPPDWFGDERKDLVKEVNND